ncbi:MAG TPA: DUF1647 domain-containing protein [Stellaceae bacterium]|jgi:hypothetical protein|nr:DUF1647 domain-containing protein [Stellaceae bacterium]
MAAFDPSAHAPAAVILSAADKPYWRSLYQFLLSAERHALDRRHRFIVYDLGLGAAALTRLSRRFPWCAFRRFRFEDYPPHVAIVPSCAWKPIMIADVLAETGGQVFWFDSATIFRRGFADAQADLRRYGVYTLRGQSALAERCDPLALAAMAAPAEILDRPERAAGVVGLDGAHPAARRLAALWREHALIESHIWPRTPKLACHRPEQALLTMLLYRLEAEGALTLTTGEIDISSPSPIRWMTSRNKLSERFPVWLDPAARAYYATAKTLDQLGWRLDRWRRTRLHGAQRRLREHFTVFLQRRDGSASVAVAAPRGSYYADPFLWREGDRDWLFVEEFRYAECRGRLCALALDGALGAGAPRPVLPRESHASFPFLFRQGGRLYLVPETCATASVDLYECVEFPDRWRLRRRLLYGVDAADSVLFERDGYWWLITSERRAGMGHRRALAIYFSRDLFGGAWQPHPVNSERRYENESFGSFRNAGGILFHRGAALRVVQINRHYYGEGLQLMQIDELTTAVFRESPFAGSHPTGDRLAGVSPHHVSLVGDLIAWDVRDRRRWRDLLPRRRARAELSRDRRLPPAESIAARAESAEIP